MNRINFCAFADESSHFTEGQIDALKRNGFQGIEMRIVDEYKTTITNENGQTEEKTKELMVSDVTLEKAREVRQKFDDAGLKIWSIGSPLGKIEMGKDSFPEHLEKVKHTLEVAKVFGAENIRMFSFYIPKDTAPEIYRNEIIDRLGKMTELAKAAGVKMCHENEKGIYGDTPERCLDILNAVPELAAIFDPANFVQCGVDTKKAWEILGHKVKYLHIKDALADGNVVPAGDGIGNIPYITEQYIKNGGNSFTVEPHLVNFAALKQLEREGEESKVGLISHFGSKEEAFDFACTRFKSIVADILK